MVIDRKNLIFTAIVALFTIYAFSFIFSRNDSSDKPSIPNMKNLVDNIRPVEWKIVDEREIDKITLVGFSYELVRVGDYDKVISDLHELIVGNGFTQKYEVKETARYRSVFCKSRNSIDIEVNRFDNQGQKITIGAYWSSQRGSSRYCKEK